MNTRLSEKFNIAKVETFSISRAENIIKRIFDLLLSIPLLILLLPIFLIFSLIIKLDGGKALYAHERIGRSGKKFKCLKFRSMASNSDELLEKLLASNPEAYEEWHTTFKLKNDPRVTKIGRFLRKSSLDEMPQLLNIIKGDMSFVGPRPITEDELPQYKEDVIYYLSAVPGLTGLWQVSGRSDLDYSTRVELDKKYVMHWSFFRDIKILAKTVIIVLMGKGAY